MIEAALFIFWFPIETFGNLERYTFVDKVFYRMSLIRLKTKGILLLFETG